MGSPDEIDYDKSWISSAQLKKVIEAFDKNSYGAYFAAKLYCFQDLVCKFCSIFNRVLCLLSDINNYSLVAFPQS